MSSYRSWRTSLALVLVLGLAAAAGAAEKRIILLTNGNSPFWDAAQRTASR